MMKKNIIIAALVALLGLLGGYSYNRITSLNNEVNRLKGEVEELMTQTNDLKDEYHYQESYVDELISVNADLEKELVDQKKEVYNVINNKKYMVDAIDEKGNEITYFSYDNEGLIQHRGTITIK